MKKEEFYSYFIPALVKALMHDNIRDGFYVKNPEQFIEASNDKKKEIDIFLDQTAGNNNFLDNIAYLFDAKSHDFKEINGVNIELFKENLEKEILEYKKRYLIE